MPTADYSSYHQPATTGADGTKLDNFIDAVQTTVNGLDNNNIAASAGIVASKLADPTTGKVLGSAGSVCAAVFPPGYEFGYTEFTASVSITATTEGTAQQVVSAGAITFDGATAVYLDFWCPFLLIGAGAPTVEFFDGATSLGGVQTIGATVLGFNMRRRVTPSAATHTYTVKAFTSAGTATVGAGAGGPVTSLPGLIRVAKA